MFRKPSPSLIACALLTPFLSGCVGPSVLEDDPLLVVLQQQQAWNRGDLLGFMAGYHRAPDTTFSSADGQLSGWDTVYQRYLARYPDRSAMGKLTFSDLKARPLGRDAFLITGTWGLARDKDAPGGVFTLIMSRFDAGWRIVHDHTSAFP